MYISLGTKDGDEEDDDGTTTDVGDDDDKLTITIMSD
jgi:hypothetical protein